MNDNGILIINTGSVAKPTTAATKVFLKEFLMDSHVLDIPAPIRWFLVNAVIVPRRAERVSHAYKRIWTDQGSPLLAISRDIKTGLRERLTDEHIEIAMRYGEPSIEAGLNHLTELGAENILVVPYFPQYAEATSGSIIDKVDYITARHRGWPQISILPTLYSEKRFVETWVDLARPILKDFLPDYVLFSYHGLPERHIIKNDPTGQHCLSNPDCCEIMTDINKDCYRAQCFATTRSIADTLGLDPIHYATAFQSRMGGGKWIEPNTSEIIIAMAEGGIKRLAVLCPSFLVDCLETIDEIGIRARMTFIEAGGEELKLIPAPNAEALWLDALADILKSHL